ncbi:MAG: transposase [Chitinophagaceae bacterium]|nr:transposase [Chitinophagaceae bacterium]
MQFLHWHGKFKPIQFFTATILEWKHLFKPDKYKDLLIQSLTFLVQENRAKIYGFVIMPNHIHLLWRIGEAFTREAVQRDFLRYTAQHIKFDLQRQHPKVLERFCVQAGDRKYQFWERNALSVDLLGCRMIEQKLHYIHQNPLQEKWNLAGQPEDYLYSSASYYYQEQDRFGFLTHYKDDC